MNMPILTQFQNAEQSMHSLDIANLVQSELRAVNLSIERLAKRGVIQLPPMVKVNNKQSLSPNNQVGVYIFSGEKGKRDSIVVVAQLCPEFTAALVDRWAELENYTQSVVEPQFQIPTSLSEALQLAADQAKKIELDKPKVDYYEKIVVRDTLLNATQVAQKIGLSAMAMNKYLDQFNVYSRGVKRARVFQQWFVDKGLGELKQTDLGFSQPMFTTKGEAWVIEKLVSEGVAA